MKQVILTAPGKIDIKDIPIPEPSDGEVVIRVHTALTCGTDLKAYLRGHKLIPMPGPFGHEYSGTVSKTGRGVRGFKEGDDIMGVHSAPCLKCEYCKKGLYNLCETIMETKVLGAFSEYLLLPSNLVEQNLLHKPKQLAFEEAALLEPLACVVHPYSRLNMENIENALVIGAGPIGLMHLAYLKAKGINVSVMDISRERLAIAEKMGADKASYPSVNFDLVVECTGRKKVWEDSLNYVRRGGNVMLFGGCASGTEVTYSAHRLHYDELNLIGSFHYTPEDVKTAFHALSEKELDLSPLISGEFRLDETEKAFLLLKEGKGIKYALKP